MVLENFGKNLESIIRKIRRLPNVDKESIAAVLQELQRTLLMADVQVEICLALTESIRKRAFDTHLNKSLNRRDYIVKILHDELSNILGGTKAPSRIKVGKQAIILLVGIQGSGKTTSVGKLAKYYSNKGMKIGVICTDTWRPGAYDQLAQHLDPLKIDHFGLPKEKNALKIAKKGLKYFQQSKLSKDLILVDTAGRHSQEADLMREMKKLEDLLKPNETILVIDGTLGQQAYSQALAFAQTTNLGSIIITKLDGSAKGGGALSAAAASKTPIKFIGVGEKLAEFEEFNPTTFIGNLMGIPNLKGLLEKVEEAGIEPTKDLEKRMRKGKLTLEDWYEQMRSLQKLGGIGTVIGNLGGYNISKDQKEQAQIGLNRMKAMIQSCTPEERFDPNIIKKTRISRIARGSGTTYTDVKGMLDNWRQMNKIIQATLRPNRNNRNPRLRNNLSGMNGLPTNLDLNQLQRNMGRTRTKRKKHAWK